MSILDLKSEAYRIKDKVDEAKNSKPEFTPDKYYSIYLKDALQRIAENI